jgi:enoyl-CoA hydratase/carnithine racemase
MREQDFELVRGELLTQLEQLVVAEHGALHAALLGERWSPPAAYRWIRYEDPDPVARLIEASRRLAAGWASASDRTASAAVRSEFAVEETSRLYRALRLAGTLGYAG